MSTVVVIGMAPLPWEQRHKHYGLGTRTWHFTKPLLDEGHRVVLVAKMMLEAYQPPAQEDLPEGLQVTRLDADSFHDPARVRALVQEVCPSCVVAVNMEAASVACAAHLSVPIWADLNGYSMGEAQARHRVVGTQDDPLIMWGQVLPILLRADVFSAVSAPQRYALIGELGAVGRLSKATLGYEFVYHIPNAVEPPPSQATASSPLESLPEGAFWVLWSGGFNTWADVHTLVSGVELAMERIPQLRFVSTGGDLAPHDPVTYRRFKALVEASPYRERFHLLGWVDAAVVDAVMRTAHVGVNVDVPCYETELGARNRLNAMMRYGLPVITTYGSEISRIVERHGLGIAVTPADPRALGGAISWAFSNYPRMKSMGTRAKDFVLEHFSFAATTRPVVKWVASPQFAPDTQAARQMGTWPTELHSRAAMFSVVPQLEAQASELRRIQRTKAFQLYHRLRRLLRP